MTLLEVRGLDAGYGDFQALFGIDVDVAEGETLAMIGANGAGKTTFLRVLAGQVPTRAGSIVFDGADIARVKAHRRVGLGIALVPEGRKLFGSLTVQREPVHRRPCRTARSLEPRHRSRRVPADPAPAGPALARAVGRRAAVGGHRPGPDVQPPAGAARRGVAGSGPGGGQITVRSLARALGGGRHRAAGGAGHRAGPSRWPPGWCACWRGGSRWRAGPPSWPAPT